MNGILLVDKPSGWTSFDVVGRIRRLVSQPGLNTSQKKRFPVGHTGTLDPLATGLLVLLLGTYTKKAPALIKLDKTYEVSMRVGQVSSTSDEEGQKTAVSDRQPTLEELHIALARFEGDIMQTPPAFSAIKVNGQRAYKLARAGKTPELPSRQVHVKRIILTKYQYPYAYFTTHVSSGTYIRSLVEDIGKALGTGAYMSSLRRTRIGPFFIQNAVPVEDLNVAKISNVLKTI